MADHNGEIFQLEKEFRQEMREGLKEIKELVNNGFTRVNGSIKSHDQDLRKHGETLVDHEARIDVQENKPSASKAVYIVGGLMTAIVTLFALINLLK